MDEIKEKIIDNLKNVYDPEISVNVYDLGLIYEVDVSKLPRVSITHTLTSAFCPAADWIKQDIYEATTSVAGVEECDVITTFDPPFGPEMMSEEVRMVLGIWE
jgi:metal-sulfur cluster biosynthetic enzyme